MLCILHILIQIKELINDILLANPYLAFSEFSEIDTIFVEKKIGFTNQHYEVEYHTDSTFT